MKYLSVFSGIESASVAWESLGWEPVGFSEIDKFPSAVLAHRYPGVKNYGDVTKFKEWDIERGSVDIMVGGSPCQAFSIAGLRGGLTDPRGNLMLTYGFLAAHLRPSWVVWENVPGVLSSNRGWDFASFLGLLSGRKITPPLGGWSNSGIVSGYEKAYGLAWRVLDAQYFDLAQQRERVFVVGYLGDWRRSAAVLFESEGLCGNPAPSRKERKAVTGTLTSRTKGGGGLGTDFDLNGGLQVVPSLMASRRGVSRIGESRGQDPVIPVISKSLMGDSPRMDGETETLIPVVYDMRGNGSGNVSPTITGDHAGRPTDYTPCVVESVKGAHTNGSGSWKEDDIAGTLRAREQDSHEQLVLMDQGGNIMEVKYGMTGTLRKESKGHEPIIVQSFAENTRAEIRLTGGDGKIVGAIGTGGCKPGQGYPMILNARQDPCFSEISGSLGSKDTGHALVTSLSVRRLTPLECERLMGFPDNWTLIPYRNGMAKDGPRYKAIGNSMAVPVMKWIGKKIQEVDNWSV
jgi:DNA (cytosine-5)-methyltransferase 1